MKRELPIMERKISNVQPFLMLIISMLTEIALAVPLANYQTLVGLFVKDRLQSKRIIFAFANENKLYFRRLSYDRLRQRLQKDKLSFLASLQVLEVSFEVCKEKKPTNQRIDTNFFAALFAKISN